MSFSSTASALSTQADPLSLLVKSSASNAKQEEKSLITSLTEKVATMTLSSSTTSLSSSALGSTSSQASASSSTTTPSTTVALSSQIISIPKDFETFETRLTNLAVQNIQLIAADHQKRMLGYSTQRSLLDGGIWYSNEYMKALKAMKQTKRLTYFLERGNFYHGYASPKHFHMVENSKNGTGLEAFCFVLNKGVTPSDGLEALYRGPTFLGCGETCQLAIYSSFLSLWGKEKFDALFAADSPTPLMTGFNVLKNPLNSFLLQKKDVKNAKKGDIAYFVNIPLYHTKHINGDGSGFITLCSSHQSQLTFCSLGLSPEGMTAEQVGEILRQEFNSEPVGMTIVSDQTAKNILSTYSPSEIALSNEIKRTKITKDYFLQNGGGTLSALLKVSAKHTFILSSLSPQEARVQFTKWYEKEVKKLSHPSQNVSKARIFVL